MKDEFNPVDKFLYKFVICLVLLISTILLDKIKVINLDNLKYGMQENFNFLKILKFVNTDNEVFLSLDINDEVTASVSQTYLNYEEINGGKRIIVNEMQGVEVYKAGVVIKVFKNNDDTYQVVVKGIDDIEYKYDKLTTVDLNIYKIVKSGDIIGKPKTTTERSYFEFYEVKYL